MTLPGFNSGEYNAASPIISAQQAINVIPEIYGQTLVFSGAPGTELVTSFGGSRVRGMHVAWGVMYVVAGTRLYEVASDGTATVLGAVPDDGSPVCMEHNIFELLCVAGGNGYTVQKGTVTFAQITDTDFPTSDRCGFLDGYGILLEKDSGRFWYTSINDFETISGIDFATAEGAPDDLESLLIDHRELWLFGKTSTEVWYNSGAATNPIQRRTFVERGCRGVFSPAKADNTVMWLGDDGIVYRADQYTPIRISNHGIEHQIQETTVDPIGFTYTDKGHVFYQLNFPGELSITYDVATGVWHRRKTRGREDSVSHHHAYAYGRHYMGGVDGNLYALNDELYQDNGDELERIRTIGPLRSQRHWTPMPSITCVFETGESPTYVDEAEIFLEISDDAGRTYGPRIEGSLGARGEYREEVKFSGLGGFRDGQRVLKLSMTDNARFTLVDAYVS